MNQQYFLKLCASLFCKNIFYCNMFLSQGFQGLLLSSFGKSLYGAHNDDDDDEVGGWMQRKRFKVSCKKGTKQGEWAAGSCRSTDKEF